MNQKTNAKEQELRQYITKTFCKKFSFYPSFSFKNKVQNEKPKTPNLTFFLKQ